MAISNYSELQTAVQNWLARVGDADIVARTPEFIALAEAQFNRDIKHRKQETQVTLTMTAGVETVALPDDYIEARVAVVQSSPKKVLNTVTPSQLATNWALETSGIPSEYAIIGSNMHVGQLPDAAYDITFTYYQLIPALSDANPTNWLLTYSADIYMYGALIQASPYIKNNEDIPVWGAMYDRGKEGLEADQNRSAWNGGPLMSRTDVTVR